MVLRVSALCALVLAVPVACVVEEPAQYARGEAIPVASWIVTVRSSEELPQRMIPDAVRAVKPGVMWLALHVDLDYEGPDADEWERDFGRLLRGIRLRVEGGEDHDLIMAPMTESHLKLLKYGSTATFEDMQAWAATSNWERTVLVFALPKESRGISLVLKNYAPRDQQPKRIAVPTGR